MMTPPRFTLSTRMRLVSRGGVVLITPGRGAAGAGRNTVESRPGEPAPRDGIGVAPGTTRPPSAGEDSPPVSRAGGSGDT